MQDFALSCSLPKNNFYKIDLLSLVVLLKEFFNRVLILVNELEGIISFDKLKVQSCKLKTAMNAKISMFVVCVEVIIYLLLYNLHV